ncbi:terminase large subunit [Arthrobacter citreus]|nr:terminase large subunit [Arthrobacter citreus]
MNLLERITNYAQDIVEGKILACKKHIAACERFLSDVQQIADDEFEFYFDADELFRFYKWSKMFKHSKGVLANQRIELTDFQLFVVANIFCWKHKVTNLRRFRKVYIQLARKNAKSQLLALITSYICFLSEEQEECYIAGWGREQSSLVYNEVLGQIEAVDLLKGKFNNSYGRIKHEKRGSIIKPLSKESRKTGDGTNPSLAVIDEFHAHETPEIYDVLISGMVARKSPLIVIITTAGFNLSSPCYTEYQYVSSILDSESPIKNDQYFVMICELDKDDDIKDERNWIKANPIVATYEEGINFISSELQTALDVPEKMRNFLTKNMNIWVDQKDNGYLDMSKWNLCGKKISLEELSGMKCIVGVDLSAKIDLTSIGFIIVKDGLYYVFSHSFMPEDTLKAKMRSDKVPYDLWVKQGWITTTPGAVVDYAFIRVYIKRMEKEYGINASEICADPWNATQFMQDMESDGYTMVEIRQGIATLGAPTKHFREEVYKGNVIHDNNPVLTWAINNAVTRQDANENIMLDKSKATDRIDPIASVMNAHVRAMLNINFESVYESRGFLVL